VTSLPALDAELRAALERQVVQVDARVRGGAGVYEHERMEIRHAVEWVARLRQELALGRFIRSLTPDTSKPQVLLLFNTVDRGPVVLKIYGRPRPSEASVQRLWWRHGVRVPRVLASGDRQVSWLLMEFLPGSTLSKADVSGTIGLLRVTREVAAAMVPAHRVDPGPLTAGRAGQPLAQALPRHLAAVLGVLVRHGYPVRPDWSDRASELYAMGPPVPLHGDLTVRNLIVGDGGLWLVDVCGYLGPAAYDAARWCARSGGPDRAEAALDAWLRVETGLDPVLVSALLGLELLMEAGVRELVKDEQGKPSSARDERTLACLATGDRLLDRWLETGAGHGR
jgi:hypothetical protein